PTAPGPAAAGPAAPGPTAARPAAAGPAAPGPAAARPAAAVPVTARPRASGCRECAERRRVERLAEDVSLAAKNESVACDVVAAPRELDGAGATRRGRQQCRRRGRRLSEHLREIDFARAL